MGNAKKNQRKTAEAESAPRGGMPGDGAGRIEDPGTRQAGVWPVSGPPSGNPEARIHDMASFGQGERGAAGYADSGESEVVTMPPDDTASTAGSGRDSSMRAGRPGEAGGNFGEVDPGISGSGETIGEKPESVSGAGRGNAVGGGGQGDIP